MAKCPNRNTVNYKALLEVYKTDLITTNVIQSWQDSTGSEAIPTVVEASNYAQERKVLFNLKQRDFGEALLNNLRREKIIHSFQGSYYIVNTEQNVDSMMPNPSLVKSNIKRLNRYLEANNLPASAIKLDETPKTFAVSIDVSLFSNRDMLEKSRSWNQPRTTKVIQQLIRMFPGINVSLQSENEAFKLYEVIPQWKKAKVPFDKINSFYLDNVVILVEGRVTDEIAIEELLHPFVDAIKLDNQDLYNSLVEESRKNFPVMSQEIEDAYNKDRRFSADERNMEVLTQALARHFKKEYEESPTKPFLDKIKDMLEWFQNIIQNLSKYLTGRRIPVQEINPNATMTDIAKLINTDGLKFEVERKTRNGTVRYSLSTSAQKVLNTAISESNTDQQKIIIDQLTHNVKEAKNEAETLSANNPDSFINNLVVLNKQNNTFYDLNTNLQYSSVSEAIGNNQSNNSTITEILDVIASREEYTGESVELFEQIRDNISDIMDSTDVLLTNVVFSDPTTKLATKAEVVIIDKFGKLKIGKVINQSKDKNQKVVLPETSLLRNYNVNFLSAEVLDMLEANMIRRMAENMGYTIQRGKYDVFSIDVVEKDLPAALGGDLSSNGPVPRPPGQNLYLVNHLIPINLYDISGQNLEKQLAEGGLDGQLYDARTDTVPEIEVDKLDPYLNKPLSYTLGNIQTYKDAIISKQEMLKKLKDNVSKDRTKAGSFEAISNTLSIINFGLIDPQNNKDVSVAYTQLLQDVFKQLKDYKAYITDPNNLKNPEFVDYLLGFQKFLVTFEGLYQFTPKKDSAGKVLPNQSSSDFLEELNATQRYLIANIEGVTTELLGPATSREAGRTGLINTALFDFAGEMIIAMQSSGFEEGEGTMLQSHGGKSFTRADMDALLTVVPDIGRGERSLRDIATSRDVILQTIDKVYKRSTLNYLDKVAARKKRIIAPLETLRKLQPGVKLNRLYDYMLNFLPDGTLAEAAYVQRIGPEYEEIKQKLVLKTRDENGVPLTYDPVFDIIAAQETKEGRESIAYNKKLAQAKANLREFTTAEKIVDKTPQDGSFQRYTVEFKEAREKMEIYNSKNFRWEKRSGQSKSAYQKYKSKYYDTVYYTKAFRVKGVPTGQVMENVQGDFVKSQYKEVKGKADNGQDFRSEKYKEIMEPKVNDALAQARRAVYDMFVAEFDGGPNSLMELLPRDYRNDQLGAIPIVRDKLATNLKNRPEGGLFVKMWSKVQSSIKNLATSTVQQKTVVINEQGRMVDSFPIMFTGSPRVEARLIEFENQLTNLKEEYKQGKLKLSDFTRERALLEGKIQQQRSRPSLGEVSTDLGSSLLMFNEMAEKFESLTEIEGTINALIKVIERREYTSPELGFIKGVVDKGVFKVKGKLGMDNVQANVVARAHQWAQDVFYENREISKGLMDKFAGAAITWSSQSYVAWNIFGNINNLAIAQVNNAIEGVSNRFMTRGSYKRSKYEYNSQSLPAAVKRTGAVVREGTDILLGSENAEEGGLKGGAVGAIAGAVVAGPIGSAIGAAIGGAAGAGLTNTEIKERNYIIEKATNQYDASSDFWRMMDSDMDIRESGLNDSAGQQNRLQRAASIGYLFQDGFEYAVQTRVGMSLLMDIEVFDSVTGESSNLYDAQVFNAKTGEVSYSDKWDLIVPNYKTGIKVKLDKNIKDHKIYSEIRNNIREVAKQIHGNYAAADKTALQAEWYGALLFQFKKWLPPAIVSRYQNEYFDGNLGWMEGRYVSTWKLFTYFMGSIKQGNFDVRKTLGEYKKSILEDNKSRPEGLGEGNAMGPIMMQLRLDNKIKNVNRTMAEAAFLFASYLAFQLLDSAFQGNDDDDSLVVKRLKNWSKYQTDRIYTELVLFVPVFGTSEMAGFLERPIASTRVLGAMSEALILSVRTPTAWLLKNNEDEFYQNTDLVYQNKPKKGQLKVYKQWRDALPLIYTLQKAASFDKMDSFRLGD